MKRYALEKPWNMTHIVCTSTILAYVFAIGVAAQGTIDVPIASWSLSENAGVDTLDVSGNGHHGMLKGGAAWTHGMSDGVGARGPIDLNANPILLGRTWSLSAWFLTPLPNKPCKYFALAESSTREQLIAVDRVTYELGSVIIGKGFRSSGFSLSTLDDGWHHIVAVGEPGSTTFYIDGAPVGSTDGHEFSDIRCFGSRQAEVQSFGPIDAIRVFDSALTGKAVETLSSEFGSQPLPKIAAGLQQHQKLAK